MQATPDAHGHPLPGGWYLRATVAYDGTDFHGFQVQKGLRTVQGALEEALAQITGQRRRVIAAGRTDTGVHALGQVVAFRTHWQNPLPDLHRAWNAVLADDVAITSLEEADEGFHPRFDAVSRTYRYTIWNHCLRNPLLRRTTFWVPQPLDLESMGRACALLVGEHDFATFGAPPQRSNAGRVRPASLRRARNTAAPRPTTVRRVMRASWSQEGNKVYLDIEANAFLYRMARSIVGTALQVGRGQLSVAQFASFFSAADRSQAGPTAPARGLCLMAVKYAHTERGEECMQR